MSRNTLIAGAVSIAILTSASYWYYNRFLKEAIPKKWRRVGTLQKIFIFPIKSCAPLKLSRDTEVFCQTLGLRLGELQDRSLMLIDDDNQMITARVYPKMVLIETKLVSPTRLIVSSPNMEEILELDLLLLKHQERPGKDVATSVWGSNLDAMLCGPTYDKWFSQCILNTPNGLRLVYFMHPTPVRETNSRMVKEPFIKQEDSGTFNDATSYMLMNLVSIDDLNTRTARPVDPLQFRGNFYVKMDVPEPYAEDTWGWVRIGDGAVFRNVAPCTRCILPNINPTTGERDPDGDPLRTLKTYRMFVNYASPALGVHLGLRQPGKIKTNDVIYAAYE